MRFRRGCRGWWLVAAVIGLDQLSKALVRRTAGAREWLPGILRCRPVRNSGVAFSMLSGRPWLLCVLTGLVLGALAAWLIARPDEPPLVRTGFLLVLGGGLGNLIDRVIFGYVNDFLDLEFMRFAIFNVADVFVCVGAALAMLGMLLAEGRKKERGHDEV